MREKLDYIDDMIKGALSDIEISPDYDIKFLNKLNHSECSKSIRGKHRIGAVSLIMSGFLMLLISTTSLKYKVVNLQMQMETSISMMQYSSFNSTKLSKIFLGE